MGETSNEQNELPDSSESGQASDVALPRGDERPDVPTAGAESAAQGDARLGNVDASSGLDEAAPNGLEGGAAEAMTPSPDAHSFNLPDLGEDQASGIAPERVTMLNDVQLHVKLQLGKTRMLVEDVLKLGEGSVVELDKLAGDPIDVLVNDRLVARGEVLVLNDVFCVRVSEVVAHDPHRVTK